MDKLIIRDIKGKLKETYMLKNNAVNAQEQIGELEKIAKLLPKDNIKKGKIKKGQNNLREAHFEYPVDRIVDLKDSLMREIDTLLSKINENHNLINMVSDITIAYILKERYFLNKPMKVIAGNINKTTSSTYRLHDKGLEMIAKKLSEK